MQLKPPQLSSHLASKLAPVYLVAGDEPLLIQEALDAIRAKARAEGYSEREVLDVERGFDWQRLADTCASLSLFASRRIVEVRMAAGPDDAGRKMLQQLARALPPDVLLLVVCGALDARARDAAWFKALDAVGVSLYVWAVKGREFSGWLETRLRDAGVRVDAEAVRLLAERTEGNLLAAAQDVAKLALLYPNRHVGVDELAQAVADSSRFEAFDLNDRVLDGDAAGAVRSLARLREEGAAPLEILGALMWSLRQLIRATLVYARTRDAAAACDSAGIRRFQQARYARALTRMRPGETMGWLRRAARIDRLVKTGQESAAWEELLTLILAASGAAPQTIR
ncbi:DNA polymerase III subunit delta [Sinimarinibacterium flocculans]|uniref:DNA polymerase III subunit delta n=1 Tax=Sinimarinibacterium flocculans TaxID=985250 RepID=A0A318EMA7_9GAMM|nr:DNA polymerase III subunit delta [Sinimarinibacterium flocculans]PXV70330.1 DNA polymerase III delta subunit [Sinimarinibacterium flocculans]